MSPEKQPALAACPEIARPLRISARSNQVALRVEGQNVDGGPTQLTGSPAAHLKHTRAAQAQAGPVHPGNKRVEYAARNPARASVPQGHRYQYGRSLRHGATESDPGPRREPYLRLRSFAGAFRPQPASPISTAGPNARRFEHDSKTPRWLWRLRGGDRAGPRAALTVAAKTELRRRHVVVLGGLVAAGPLSIDTYLPALPALSRSLHSSASQTQLTLTACLVGLALGQLVAGPLSDRFGRRGPLMITLGAYAGASLLCALAPSTYILMALRLLQGLTGAGGVVIARAVVRDLYSGAHAARMFSLLMLVTGLAPILAPVIGGQLLRITSWRGIFVVLCLCGAVLAAAARSLPETLPPDDRGSSRVRAVAQTFKNLARDRGFAGYALACGFGFGSMFGYIAGSPFVLQDIYGASPQLFSLIFALNAAGIVVVSQTNRRLVQRVGPRRLLQTAVCVQALGGLALVGAVAGGLGGLVTVIVPLFFVVASFGAVLPNATALALWDHQRVAGSASALLGAFQFLLGASAAPLVGLAGTSSAVPMATVIALFAAAAVVSIVTLTRGRPAG